MMMLGKALPWIIGGITAMITIPATTYIFKAVNEPEPPKTEILAFFSKNMIYIAIIFIGLIYLINWAPRPRR